MEVTVNWIAGLVLIAGAVGMIVIARPADGESAPFLKSQWIVGQLYALTALAAIIGGMTLIITHWPF